MSLSINRVGKRWQCDNVLIDGRFRIPNVKGKIMHNLGNICRAAARNYIH